MEWLLDVCPNHAHPERSCDGRLVEIPNEKPAWAYTERVEWMDDESRWPRTSRLEASINPKLDWVDVTIGFNGNAMTVCIPKNAFGAWLKDCLAKREVPDE